MPNKTCPSCSQICVVEFTYCRRCGYNYGPAPDDRRTVILWAVGIFILAVSCVIIGLATLGGRNSAAYGFAGDWYSPELGQIRFNPGGAYDGRPPGWANGPWKLSWKRSGPFVQLIQPGEYPQTFTYQWTVSDDGKLLTVINQADSKLYTASRVPPR